MDEILGSLGVVVREGLQISRRGLQILRWWASDFFDCPPPFLGEILDPPLARSRIPPRFLHVLYFDSSIIIQ